MRKILAIFILALGLLEQANANFICSGKVTYLGIGESGQLTVAVGVTPIHAVCSMKAAGDFTIGEVACKAMYTSLLAAKLSDKSVSIYYTNDNYTCPTLPNWGVATFAYFLDGPNS